MNRDCKALNAEVERLTKENAELKASGRQAIDAGEKIIERLTKELEEARLQDPNQWRREYWKHYNDLKARADYLAAELAKATKELGEALQRGVVLAIKSEKNEHRADTLRATIERLTKERDFQLAAAVEATRREQEHKARADYLAAELAKAREALTRAVSLIDAMMTNDPNEHVSDAGHVALDLWKHGAEQLRRTALPATPEPQT
jgi:chromosome segregation ATPase